MILQASADVIVGATLVCILDQLLQEHLVQYHQQQQQASSSTCLSPSQGLLVLVHSCFKILF
jgi:hypothetical protein